MNTTTTDLIVTLPFPGFYHSDLSQCLDNEECNTAEFYAEMGPEEEGSEQQYPEALRLTVDAIQLALFESIQYDIAHQYLAKDYVATFVQYFAKDGITTGMEFESMVSPREYNFTTDRVFATVPLTTVQRWFEETPRDALEQMIRERHTSYSGFYSYYTTYVDEWLAKPLDQWDHNELATLLLARIKQVRDRHTEYDIIGWMCEGNAFGEAIDAALDKEKFEARRAAMRAAKAA